MSQTVRTFIAVPLEESVRGRAAALQEQLAAAGAAVKWVEPHNLHITLVFLGEIDMRAVPEVCGAAAEAAAGAAPVELVLAGVGAFPNPRRPKTLWAGVADGREELRRLHAALEERLAGLGAYRREEREYTPHLTIGRVKSDRGAAALGTVLARHAGWQGGRTTVREIHVLSSELTPEGPVYTVLSRAPLGGAG